MADDTTNTEALTDETETEETTEETQEEEEESTGDSDETESEEQSADSSEETPEQIIDLAKVPPALREAAKRMQNTLRKEREKQNKWKSEIEEKLGLEYAQHVQLSHGFQRLVNTPGFAEFWNDLKAGNPYGHSSMYNRGNGNSESGDGGDSSADSEGKISVDAVVSQVMKRIGAEIDKKIAPLQQQNAKTTLENAEKNLPNFKKYRPKITELMESEGMTLDRAYQVASEPDRIQQAVQDAINKANNAAKTLGKNKTTKPSVGTKGGGALGKKTIKSIDEAVASALADLGG